MVHLKPSQTKRPNMERHMLASPQIEKSKGSKKIWPDKSTEFHPSSRHGKVTHELSQKKRAAAFPLVWAPKLRNRKGTTFSQKNGQHFPLTWTSRLRSRKGAKFLPEKQEAFPPIHNDKMVKCKGAKNDCLRKWEFELELKQIKWWKKGQNFLFFWYKPPKEHSQGGKRNLEKILTKLSLTLMENPPPQFSQKNRPPLFTQKCFRWSDGSITEKWTISSPYLMKFLSNPQKVSEKKRAAPLFFTQKCLRWNDEKWMEKMK